MKMPMVLLFVAAANRISGCLVVTVDLGTDDTAGHGSTFNVHLCPIKSITQIRLDSKITEWPFDTTYPPEPSPRNPPDNLGV